MKKELLNKELNMVNGGEFKEYIAEKIFEEMETMTKLVRMKKLVDQEKDNPIHAYDMVEYNKR